MKNFFIVAGTSVLIASGAMDLSATSKSSYYGSSWFDETSFMALNIRSRGSLKVGLGLIALSLLGNSESGNSVANTKNTNSQSPSKKRRNGLLSLLGAPDPDSFERPTEKETDQEN